MIRIKKTALIEENNKFLYRYKAFTGIVFDIVGEQVTDIFECKDGVRIADYHSSFVPKEQGDLCVDFEAFLGDEEIDEEYGPFLYQGTRYTGLSYEFEDDFCVAESRYINGIPSEEVGWFPNEELASFWTYNNDITQIYHWYENGFFESIDITNSKHDQTLEIEFTKKQEIKTIRASVDYLNKSPEIEQDLRYHYLIGYTLVEGARIAPRLFASGLGVNDQFFSELQSCAGFNKMETLLLYTTSISTESLLNLENHPALKSISVNDEREDIIQTTRELKLRHPNCVIELNDIEI